MRLGGFHGFVVAAVVSLSAIAPAKAEATLINIADVNGYRVFQDTATSLVWLDLDNFSGKSHNEMATAAIAAGFTVATRSQVDPLLTSLALPDAAAWDSYATVMGQSPERDVIFGSFGPIQQGNVVGIAYAFRGDTAWTFNDPAVGADTKFPDWATDMNLWAFQGSPTAGDQVPEPASLLLMGTGLFTLGVLRLRRRVRMN